MYHERLAIDTFMQLECEPKIPGLICVAYAHGRKSYSDMLDLRG